MKTVSVKVQHVIPRTAFRSGGFKARLEDEDSKEFAILGTTRVYDTWAEAGTAGLRLADKRGFLVQNRGLVERRIREKAPT